MATPTKKASRIIPRQIDEDEDEAPRSRRVPPKSAEAEEPEEEPEEQGKSNIRRGFSAARQVTDSTSSFAQALKLDDKVQIIKFLEDEPYASYTRHWIERKGPQGITTRSYNCMKNFGRDCPLCDAGDKAQATVAFNVALIGDDGVPMLKTFDCGPKLLGIVEGYARDPKVAPISKAFFLASRSGKKGSVNYNLVPVKARSLDEDYDIEPPTPEEFKKLGLYDTDMITAPKMKDMEELAAEIADEY